MKLDPSYRICLIALAIAFCACSVGCSRKEKKRAKKVAKEVGEEVVFAVAEVAIESAGEVMGEMVDNAIAGDEEDAVTGERPLALKVKKEMMLPTAEPERYTGKLNLDALVLWRPGLWKTREADYVNANKKAIRKRIIACVEKETAESMATAEGYDRLIHEIQNQLEQLLPKLALGRVTLEFSVETLQQDIPVDWLSE